MRISRGFGAVAAKACKRWLYLVHRWLGVAACVFFLFWFVSGVVMMYVPYPSLKPDERLAGLAPIAWESVAVQPTAAIATAGFDAWPREVRLDMAAGEPAWRLRDDKGSRIAISAVDGRRLSAPDSAAAAAAAIRFAHGAPVRSVTRIDDDQWTVAAGFNWARPFWRVALDDAAGTELYIASTTGEVAQNTDRVERAWNWMGSVPHWLYLTAVRRDAAVWRQVVMWTSGPATIVGLTGIWIGILRIRVRRRYKNGSVSPYRSWWLKWHHIIGLVGGVFAITWMASGWLSVNPFDLFTRAAAAGGEQRYARHDEPDYPALATARLGAALPGAREARLAWVDGRATVTLSRTVAATRTMSPDGAPIAFTQAQLVIAARRLLPAAPIVATEVLREPDIYWYSHNSTRPLPALRVVFGDRDATWATIDPASGALLAQQVASARTYRWLFNALHDFDLPFLLAHRALRDPLMWLLSLFGFAMSATGVVIGWRRIVRKLARQNDRAMNQ